jgi:uncharacterized protein YegL
MKKEKNVNEKCLIVLVLDESGSMASCKSDTIGGFNEFLKTQKKIKGEANFTLVKFSDYYKVINEGIPLEKAESLNESNYTPSFSTALLDAVGKTINSTKKRIDETPKKERAKKVIFTIITDGYENASHEFSKTQIFDMIKECRDKYNYEFLFLGADVDAWGAEIGILANVNISKDDLSRSFKGMSYYTANYRTDCSNTVGDFNLTEEELDKELSKHTKQK